MRNSNRRERLERTAYEGITFIEPSRDERGLYIPYCKLRFHPGIIDEEKAKECERRNCWHYKKLYV